MRFIKMSIVYKLPLSRERKSRISFLFIDNVYVPKYAADGQNHGFSDRLDRYWEYHTTLDEFSYQLMTMIG